MRLENVHVIIPALNEERSLPHVLAALPAVGKVWVVDNGSMDRTAQVAAEHGAVVVQEPQRGYGAACLAGIAAVSQHSERIQSSPAVIVFLDGDFSDFPENLPVIVKPILQGKADFVVGSRLLGHCQEGAMPPHAVWGNRLACWLMRRIWGTLYTDLGPFRAIAFDRLLALNMQDQGYGWTVEMQIKAARAKLRIQEVAVPYRKRLGKSKVSGTVRGTLGASYKILATIARYGFTPLHRDASKFPTPQTTPQKESMM